MAGGGFNKSDSSSLSAPGLTPQALLEESNALERSNDQLRTREGILKSLNETAEKTFKKSAQSSLLFGDAIFEMAERMDIAEKKSKRLNKVLDEGQKKFEKKSKSTVEQMTEEIKLSENATKRLDKGLKDLNKGKIGILAGVPWVVTFAGALWKITKWGPKVLKMIPGLGGWISSAGMFVTTILSGLKEIKDVSIDLVKLAIAPIKAGFQGIWYLVKQIGNGIKFIGETALKTMVLPLKVANSAFDMTLKKGNELIKEQAEIRRALEETKNVFSRTGTTSLFGDVKKFEKMRKEFFKTESMYVKRFGFDIEGITNVIRTGVKHVSDMGVFSEHLGKGILRLDGELPKRVYALDTLVKGLGLTGESLEYYAQESVLNRQGMITTLVDLKDTLEDVSHSSEVDLKRLSKNFLSLRKDIINFGHLTDRELANTTARFMNMGVSVESVTGMFNKFNTFEDAAKSAAMLSQAFGMNIDALKIIKSEDPMDIIDMFRESLAATGRSFNEMNRYEKRLLQTHTGLSAKTLKSAMNYRELGIARDKALKDDDTKLNKQIDSINSLTSSVSNLVKVLTFDSLKEVGEHAMKRSIINSKKAKDGLIEVSKEVARLQGQLTNFNAEPIVKYVTDGIQPVIRSATGSARDLVNIFNSQVGPSLKESMLTDKQRIEYLDKYHKKLKISAEDLSSYTGDSEAAKEKRNQFFINRMQNAMTAFSNNLPFETIEKAFSFGAKTSAGLAGLLGIGSTSLVNRLNTFFISDLPLIISQNSGGNTEQAFYDLLGINSKSFNTHFGEMMKTWNNTSTLRNFLSSFISTATKEIKRQFEDDSSQFNLNIKPKIMPVLKDITRELTTLFARLFVMFDDATGIITKKLNESGDEDQLGKWKQFQAQALGEELSKKAKLGDKDKELFKIYLKQQSTVFKSQADDIKNLKEALQKKFNITSDASTRIALAKRASELDSRYNQLIEQSKALKGASEANYDLQAKYRKALNIAAEDVKGLSSTLADPSSKTNRVLSKTQETKLALKQRINKQTKEAIKLNDESKKQGFEFYRLTMRLLSENSDFANIYQRRTGALGRRADDWQTLKKMRGMTHRGGNVWTHDKRHMTRKDLEAVLKKQGYNITKESIKQIIEYELKRNKLKSLEEKTREKIYDKNNLRNQLIRALSEGVGGIKTDTSSLDIRARNDLIKYKESQMNKDKLTRIGEYMMPNIRAKMFITDFQKRYGVKGDDIPTIDEMIKHRLEKQRGDIYTPGYIEQNHPELFKQYVDRSYNEKFDPGGENAKARVASETAELNRLLQEIKEGPGPDDSAGTQVYGMVRDLLTQPANITFNVNNEEAITITGIINRLLPFIGDINSTKPRSRPNTTVSPTGNSDTPMTNSSSR